MALQLRLEKLSLEQLEREITCGICQEHYTEPKALPCLHYYCKQCILRLALRTGKGQPFLCPECRSEATLPEGGVDKLKSAFFVNRFQSLFSMMERVEGKVEVKCEACIRGAVATSFCRQCTLFICDGCVNVHKTMKTVFEGHEVVSISDLKEGRARPNIFLKEPRTVPKCNIHNEELKMYCFCCNTLICRDCTLLDHKDHTFQFCAVAAPTMKEELLKELEPLRELGRRLSRVVEEVKSTRQEIEAQGETVAQTINTSFDKLVQVLEKRRVELLEEAGRSVQKKVDRLTTLEKTLSLANVEVQSVVDYTERGVGHCSDNEVMSMHTEIKEQISKKLGLCNIFGSMESAEEVDVGVEVSSVEDLQQLLNTKNRVFQLPIDPNKCTVSGDGVKTAEVNQTAQVTLIANVLSNSKPTRRSATIDGHLKSLYDGSVVQCDVDQSEPGEYHIKYTPKVRGRHELYLSVDQQQVAGSPFSLFVSIHPTQLHTAVLALRDLCFVSAVGVNSSGVTVVGQQQHKETITFWTKTKLLKAMDKKHLKLDDHRIVGLTIDSKNYIYFTLYDSNALTKMCENGSIVKQVRAKQITGHLGLAIVGDEVMVCPRPNKGIVEVYDKELNYARRLEYEGMGEFRDLAADSKGNLYITDWKSKCIRVCSSRGDFLRSFCTDSKGSRLLTKPRGICVAGEFVYVCNDGTSDCNHSVFVFTTKGDYVACFGRKGSKLGEFDSPYAICSDKDGFIYVTDMHSVQVF